MTTDLNHMCTQQFSELTWTYNCNCGWTRGLRTWSDRNWVLLLLQSHMSFQTATSDLQQIWSVTSKRFVGTQMHQCGRDCNCTCINIYLAVHMHTHCKHNSLIIKQKARLYDPSIAKKGQTINHHHQDIRAPEPRLACHHAQRHQHHEEHSRFTTILSRSAELALTFVVPRQLDSCTGSCTGTGLARIPFTPGMEWWLSSKKPRCTDSMTFNSHALMAQAHNSKSRKYSSTFKVSEIWVLETKGIVHCLFSNMHYLF